MLRRVFLVFLSLCSLSLQKPPTPLDGSSWALLVAGSNGWGNYRHQADICHSYHVMVQEGIPADHIVVMMYDDIAFNDANPNKGVIINQPNGNNVYKGVQIDYKGSDITPENFLAILSGNATAVQGVGTGRVIQSNKNTNVFVYFADHGSTGTLEFVDDTLYADDLIKTLQKMHKNKSYKELMFFVESCESGSMFNHILPNDIGVYAFTASARDESSYGTYCSWNSTLGCLGDEFSITWMEQMDSGKKGETETFFHLFQSVRARVINSHVEIYGNYHNGAEVLTPNKNSDGVVGRSNSIGQYDVVSSRDIPIYIARGKFETAFGEEKVILGKTLSAMLKAREVGDNLMSELALVAAKGGKTLAERIENSRLLLNLDVFPCYKRMLEAFREICFDRQHEYFFQHHYKFANMCLLHLDTNLVIAEMESLCNKVKDNVTVIIQ